MQGDGDVPFSRFSSKNTFRNGDSQLKQHDVTQLKSKSSKNTFRNGDSHLRQHDVTQLKSINKCKGRGGILEYVFMIHKNVSSNQFKQMAFRHKFTHCSLDFATCTY